ncbi:helix-turn-helix domain-containing protein [Paraburkholderia fungorum]|uniref:helix-turn-helix domain-containing protein n=1 Tax=Paraburkholderia fungorum TaxID=134537 RepID=UPI00402B1961
MSNDFCIGPRIKEERERLRFQAVLAEAVGVTRQSVLNWESGAAQPPAAALAAMARLGLDVLYILTGERSQPVTPQELLPEVDRIFLDNLHAAPAEVQRGVKITLDAFAPRGTAGGRHRSHRKSA